MPSSGAELLSARVVLDTSAYSRMRRGEDRVLDAVAEAEVVFVPATVVGELEAAFRMGSRYRVNRRDLDEFLLEPYVNVLDLTTSVARRYGEVFAALRAAGKPIPVNDIWIAAATFISGAHLITFDEDFIHVDGLPHTLFSVS